MSAQVEAIKVGLPAHFGEWKDPRSTANHRLDLLRRSTSGLERLGGTDDDG